MAAVMKPQIDELADKVQHELMSILSGDFAKYKAGLPATPPTTDPTATPATMPASTVASSPVKSSLGMPFDSDQYLPALAVKVQQDTGVLPVVEQINKPIARDDASHLPGIGAAQSSDGMLSMTAALDDPTMMPFQPSVPLSDESGTTYFFRIRQRIAAHRPASLADVASTVEANWRLSKAFDDCRTQADKLLAAAKDSSLTAAAHAANLDIDYPSPFALSGPTATGPIKGLPLTGDSVDVFRQGCQSLLSDAAEHKPAVTSVESPLDGKILVAELSGVSPEWPPSQRGMAEAEVAAELRYKLARPLQTSWFKLADVTQRIGYKDVEKKS